MTNMRSMSQRAKKSGPKPLPPAAFEKAEAADREFLNRDLSWLEFNRRVLHEALDERTPLLERVRFLGIFGTNLDEFFMKRTGAIRRADSRGALASSSTSRPAGGLLMAIRQSVLPMLQQQAECFTRVLRPALVRHGIHLLKWDQLEPAERDSAQRYFRSTVFPVLTPLAVDPGHPFPFISNLSTSLGLILTGPDSDERSFARVKVPEVLPKWIRLSGPSRESAAAAGEYRFISLLDLIRHHLPELFPGMVVQDVMAFRLTRDAEIEPTNEEEPEDLRDLVEQEVRQRRFADTVRLEHAPDPNPWMLQFLMHELKLSSEDLYEMPGELDYDDLRPIAELNLPKLRYEPWTPVVPVALADDGTSIFSLIRQRDLLVHHPYESFSASVERFVQAAADDPHVLAIKMIVYRTSGESPFIHTLIRAAETRKQAVCLVELQARFDEERNISLAHELEKAGVHVVYGLLGLKTHAKVTLVVRQDPDGIRCYAHIGTGNYHVQTARLYTDLGLLTSKPEITEDLVELFHYLTGRSLQRSYRKLIVAPVTMRERFLAMIDREVEHQKAGRPAHIIAKMNALEDRKIGRALYAASQAGVKIDLIVRGFCCLRPGIKGLSDNIRVISVIGRFLEHSRVFYFRNGAEMELDGEFYIGSADWMYRNLQARMEVVAPIEERGHRERLWEIFQTMFHDNRQAWDMRPDGTYVQRRPADGEGERATHAILMNLARQRGLAATEIEGK